MPASVFEAIAAIGARAVVAGRDFTWHVDGRPLELSRRRSSCCEDLPPPALPGAIQYRERRHRDRRRWRRSGRRADATAGASRARCAASASPGRFQIVPGAVEWILDVAHNEPAARVLAAHLRERPCAGRTIAVVSILGDKDVAAIVRALEPVVDQWILCSLDEPRGLSAQELAARASALGDGDVTLADQSPPDAQRRSALAKPGDRVVVCGSFLAVGRRCNGFDYTDARLFSSEPSPSWKPRSKKDSPVRSFSWRSSCCWCPSC